MPMAPWSGPLTQPKAGPVPGRSRIVDVNELLRRLANDIHEFGWGGMLVILLSNSIKWQGRQDAAQQTQT